MTEQQLRELDENNYHDEWLHNFIDSAILEEREACAELALSLGDSPATFAIAEDIAAAIRTRDAVPSIPTVPE